MGRSSTPEVAGPRRSQGDAAASTSAEVCQWALRVAARGQAYATGTHPDDFHKTDNAVAAVDQVAVAGGAQEEGEPEGPALAVISLDSMNLSASHALKQGGALVLVIVFMSMVSFGFTAIFFGLALHLPSPREQPPEGYSSWEACAGGPDPASPVTALGEQFPYSKARAIASLPKFIAIATLPSLVGALLAGGLTWAVGLHAILQYTIAVIAAAVYLLRQASGAHSMPQWADSLVSLLMVCLFCWFSAVSIRARRQVNSVVALCPRVLFALAVFLLYSLNIALVNIIDVMARQEAEPTLVVCVSVVVLRGVRFAARQVLKSLSVPFVACCALLFAFDISVIVALRRYVLSLPSLANVAASAVVSAVAEFICNAASMSFAVYSYNHLVKQRRAEMASVQIQMFVAAIASELIAEHVALHSSLGYHIFIDTRVLSVEVQADLSQVYPSWALSSAIEIAVDAVMVVPMVLLLPVSFTPLFGEFLRSWAAVVFFLYTCVHPHLAGLNNYLDEGRFFCT